MIDGLWFWSALLVLCHFVPTAFAADRRPGQMQVGKWVGYVQPDGSPDVLALSMDSFLLREDGVGEFPRLYMLLKVGLGGYSSREYETELFANVQYDFDKGLLVLDEPDDEMVINAMAYATDDDATELEGTVLFRSSGATGKIYLRYQDDMAGSVAGPLKFAPTLAGQYEGTCGGEKAVLQIETGRGQTIDPPVPTTGLRHYNITGALGVDNGLCSQVNTPELPAWCLDHAFSSGSYDYFQGKVFLSGTLESNECTRSGEDLTCKTQLLPKDPDATGLIDATCHLHRVRSVITPFRFYQQQFYLQTTPDQKKPLPQLLPPANADLVKAAGGAFYGYLHHETLDRYEPLRLSVNATSTTTNPHIENSVFVSISSGLYFGRDLASEVWPRQFDRTTLYLTPGFTLKSDKSDAFLQVTKWTQGYISGVWYSKGFGRVGTFEVIKGSALPTLPPAAKVVGSAAGQFQGPKERSNGGKDYWDVRLQVPAQPSSSDSGFLLFQGNARLHAGGVAWPSLRIPQGAYDVYSGALAWMMDGGANAEARLVTGLAAGDHDLSLFWPSERSWAVSLFDETLGTYLRPNP